MPTLSSRWQAWVSSRARSCAGTEPFGHVMRDDLLSIEQLARHAQSIAGYHQVTQNERSNKLLDRLGQNEKIIRAFNKETNALDPSQHITPAAEWLLDNFYLIEEQIQMARRHLPRGYSRELPRLVNGNCGGFPRIYEIVLEFISHVDAEITVEPLRAFIVAYQKVTSLKLGELWAIPIMLRLGLIENLQRVTSRIAIARTHQGLAEMWVNRLQLMAELHPSRLVVVVAEMAKADLPKSSAFVSEFCQRLARHSTVLAFARTWLEEQLAEHGLSIEQLVQRESQTQAADRVSVSHSIASLRLLGAIDWKDFVEDLSLVEEILKTDPAGVYTSMDFATRDRYRHVVESMARLGGCPEAEVARKVVALAETEAQGNGAADRTAHVGYYLIDKGLPSLEHAVGVTWLWKTACRRFIQKFPMAFYTGGIGIFTLIATVGFMRVIVGSAIPGWSLVCYSLVVAICSSQLAVGLMNRLSLLLVKPLRLPRLDFSKGIPTSYRTMVVVPTMMTSHSGVIHLLETLEIHYLANRDPCIHFALLTDFGDAATEVLPMDEELLQRMQDGIAALNLQYSLGKSSLFYLFHRPRKWNDSESRWMGYERKRGKLTEFNSLLLGGSTEAFSCIVGDIAILREIKYVITLDTDTQLPRDAARRLAGTMAHPLNHPVFNDLTGIVTEGYGILQPRVGVSLPGSRRSWFARVFSGDAGIDPYTREVSDAYQDIFQQGTFIGKGIYDVDAFQRALDGRFPQNTVLSHDLLESCHARSALVSDVEFYESHPSRYNVDVARRHRWIRGDWQITQWLLPRVPGPAARRIVNPLSMLSLWKIFDNLRRSLVPVALMVLFLAHWFFLHDAGHMGSLVVVAIIILPALLGTVLKIFQKQADLPWTMHCRDLVESGWRHLVQVFLTLAFLPYDAYISVDAISRTLFRLLITKQRLLEWQTSSDAEGTARSDLLSFFARMWIAPVNAILVMMFLAIKHPGDVLVEVPILGLWLASPWIAWWISRPIEKEGSGLTKPQTLFLRGLARKTWHFFETFVTEKEHWLPPDNFQEIPVPVIATRTSPTNMGLALLANMAAWDFGYISTGTLIKRTEDALSTMQGLEKYRDHFYNWYDTRSLRPMRPLYISSVDSGNLAGHLLTLGSGLKSLIDSEVHRPQIFDGLLDTVRILKTLTPPSPDLAKLETTLQNQPSTVNATLPILEAVAAICEEIVEKLRSEAGAASKWALTLLANTQDHLDELKLLAQWLDQPKSEPTDKLKSTESVTAGTARQSQHYTLRELAQSEKPLPSGDDADAGDAGEAGLEHLASMTVNTARQRVERLSALARECERLAVMDFNFLYDQQRDLFAVGCDVNEGRLDTSFYDLLASEARLCSFVAIALGQVPQDHWFSMSRLLVASESEPILVSWSGSMFEYLMPLLVMPNYENTLLEHSCKAAVRHQMAYGKRRGVPWGISESGYHRTDAHFNYQYRAFGVPGLGLKRGLADDLVIAPYASVMALQVMPEEACENLERLVMEGREGLYGLYEAVDYSPARLPPDQSSVTVQSFMAHHQGMSLLALVNQLHDGPMQRRFMECPMFKAADLLLQERVPRTAASVFTEDLELETTREISIEETGTGRMFTSPSGPSPDVHLLSNGRYHVMVSSAGGGYRRWRDLAVTRWREDATRDGAGLFIYLRDVATGETWSTTHQPTLRALKGYEVIFTQARAEFKHRHAGLQINTEISVSPEDDVELHRITITNRTSVERTVELTSYAEVVLAPAAADAAHPAFSNLFVTTEFDAASSAILCTRRGRSVDEKPPWLMHLMIGHGGDQGEVSCETNRSTFIGRGRSLVRPSVMDSSAPLSNTTGSVLDPIVSLRRSFKVNANSIVVINVVTGVGADKSAILAQVEKYQSRQMVDRAFDLAWTHSSVTLHQLDATEAEALLYGRLAGALIYADPSRRASSAILRTNRRGQSGLWSYGISGDVPIVILRISDIEKIDLVRQAIRAHAYWRLKGLTAELVILNEDTSLYRQSLHLEITNLILAGIEAQMLDQPGGIFVRQMDQIPNDDRILLQTVARIVLDDAKGSLLEQIGQHGIRQPMAPAFVPSVSRSTETPVIFPPRDLKFNNGYGGFSKDGQEYVITLQPAQMTPAPWVNVLANPEFGTVISECGSAYTWAENAREFRLTPWSNDPVQDPTGEAFYIRDEETGQFWSPTPLPARGATPYVIRHGFGYSVFEHTEHGIVSEVWIYVAMDAPVKFTVLKLHNISGRPRKLTVTGYSEWVLGDLRHKTLLHVLSEVDLKSGALLARNPYNIEFPDRVAFIDVNDSTRTVTGDRKEFIGRNGSLADPAALKRERLSGRVGAGMDPCGAVQIAINLSTGQERQTSFRLGVGRNLTEARELINRFRKVDSSRVALEGVWSYWNRILSVVSVDTPDSSVNFIANGWLLYQTISSRLWGRTGFYQSGGAYGFRDQLQDVMALVHAEPALARAHLLRAAAHQFREGDVQHWWHPPSGRGVRTHFSDDFLWLPYVTCRYVTCIHDTGVLDEPITYLEARQVKPEEESYYDVPVCSEESASLYQHCVRAIERGLNFGQHGLPLIGGGDWSDGLNTVGQDGRGESVWLAFFFHDVLTKFAHLAHGRGDNTFADRCLAEAGKLQANIELNDWDGEWYRRAYFDNGDPLGSHTNEDCQIDSLPQSWAVISGAGESARSRQAMESVNRLLVRRDVGLIQLFTPPFDKSVQHPGYIKGYVAGVRENGGQYTHGAIWTAMAFALLGEDERAWELFGMLNPINHGKTSARIETYKVEPYVIAADVYAVEPHVGRGGWTWYTGSASWMYQLVIETLLGIHLEGDHLRLLPRMPSTWSSYKIHYRFRQTLYHITILRIASTESQPAGMTLDGEALNSETIPLVDDRREHFVDLRVNG